VERYAGGQRGKVAGILVALNSDLGTAFSLEEEGLIKTARAAREEINRRLEGGEAGGVVSRKRLKGYRKALLEGVKKLEKYGKQREIMGEEQLCKDRS
jgi:hypothetical protein